MLIGMHDRINGHANRIHVLDRFLTYATSHENVWSKRKGGCELGFGTQGRYSNPASRTRKCSGPPGRLNDAT